jgi:hypothetical protein
MFFQITKNCLAVFVGVLFVWAEKLGRRNQGRKKQAGGDGAFKL